MWGCSSGLSSQYFNWPTSERQFQEDLLGVPGGPVVINLLCKARHTGLISGDRWSGMIPHALERVRLHPSC